VADNRQPNNNEMWRILSSRELKGFWESIERMRNKRMKLLLKDRDTAHIDGINVIDKIVDLRESYKK